MRFLEQYLVDHPVTMYVVAVSTYFLNLALYAYADRRRRQLTAISSSFETSLRSRSLATVYGALLFLIPGLFLKGDLRALFPGGFIVMQLASMAMIVSNLQTTSALVRPNAVSGQIVYPRSTVARLAAANLAAFSFFSLGAFALTGSPSFFSAALYLGLTSLGYQRRALQHESKECVGSTNR